MAGRHTKPPILRDDAWNEPPYGSLILRSLKRSDRTEWHAIRRQNYDWLKPWEATIPVVDGEKQRSGTYDDYIRALNKAARAGESFMWGVFLDGAFVGQISLGPISYGSQRGGHVGYWVSQHVAGRGVTPTAVALVLDYAFQEMKLHRVEVNIRPENASSIRVAEKLGLRFEGLRKAYLHINGEWADHNAYAILENEYPQGALAYLRQNI